MSQGLKGALEFGGRFEPEVCIDTKGRLKTWNVPSFSFFPEGRGRSVSYGRPSTTLLTLPNMESAAPGCHTYGLTEYFPMSSSWSNLVE